MIYTRSRALVMQHTHELKIRDRNNLLSNSDMIADIELYIKCKLSVAHMVKILNKKYARKVKTAKHETMESACD